MRVEMISVHILKQLKLYELNKPMKKYKYITIKKDGVWHAKPKYDIINNKSKEVLALLFYYKAWKQYVFTQIQQDAVFNNSCLRDIIDFIETECI